MTGLIKKLNTALSNHILFSVTIFLLCLVLVGVPALYLPAKDINVDTYQYLSIANYYLLDPAPVLRDVYTVGPVIPVLIAVFKYALSLVVPWNKEADVLLLKGMALLCYVTIGISGGVYLRKTLPPILVIVFLMLLMGLPDWGLNYSPHNYVFKDGLSLNGELVSVALMTILLAYLNKSNAAPNIVIVFLLTALVLYVKVQSVILLFLLLISCYYNKNERWSVALLLFAGLVIVDLVLYAYGTGLIHRAPALYAYTSHSGDSPGIVYTVAHVAYSGIRNLVWAVTTIEEISPLFVFIVVYLIFTDNNNQDKTGSMFTDWKLWLFALLVTILTPGYQFGHYVVYALLFVIIFAKPALTGIATKTRAQAAISIPALIIVFCFITVKTITARTSIEKAGLRVGPDIEAAAVITKKGGGQVFIHGHDYKLYTHFNGWDDGVGLGSVTLFGKDPSWYLNRVLDKKYPYIVDVVGYSGIIRGSSYQITDSTVYGQVLGKHYDLILNKNGLRVFRLKSQIQSAP